MIFASDGTYLGQYALTHAPSLTVGIRDESVVVWIESDSKGRIDLTRGPPDTALVDGEIIRLFK
ncbi:hypothetical protein IP84_00055 [beta proteobacterium AAP99]|nr:hypothetical protein IP84_00055 [beta proteobacterium AAP99]